MFEWLAKRKQKREKADGKEKPRAVAFVDFEYWYVALERLHHAKPDVRAWRDDLNEQFEILDIYVFGDFGSPSLKEEIPSIRQITSSIIETQNIAANAKKDFTDFIMLDHIYRRAMGAEHVDVFILLTGDGHFSSAASFLATNLRKKVGVYGVRGSVSAQLESASSWLKLLPDEDFGYEQCRRCILSNLHRLRLISTEREVYPTFRATADAVSRYYRLDRMAVEAALSEMIRRGELIQTLEAFPDRTLRVLRLGSIAEAETEEA